KELFEDYHRKNKTVPYFDFRCGKCITGFRSRHKAGRSSFSTFVKRMEWMTSEPFSCHMCKSPFVVNLKKSGKKGGRSRHMPLPKIRIDKNTNQEMQLCNACVALYDKPLRRRISKPVDVPTEEQQTKYKEGITLALTHRRLLQDWRTRAQQGQAEARRVLAEMLTPAGATHFNCNTFITMVTGCSNSTITKVCNHMTLTGGIRDPPEHGLKKYWQEHFKKAGTRSENTETQDAEIAEGSGKRKKTVSEHPSKSQSPPAVSHPPAVPASTGHMVVQGRAQTHTSRESELPSMQVIPNSRNSSLTGQQILNQPVKIPLTNKDVDLNPPMMDHSNFQLFMPPPPKYRENLSYTNKLREMSRNMTFSMTSQPMTPHLVTSHHVTSHQMTSLPVTTLSMTSLAPQANMSNYGLIHPIVQQQIQNNQSQSFVDQHLSHLQQMQLQSPVEIVQRANIIESQPPMVPTLVQQMTLDPSQSYQLVTDQGNPCMRANMVKNCQAQDPGKLVEILKRETDRENQVSIDGMEMCEIEASPSIEEMIRVAESDAGNIPLGRMEYRPHSRTGLLAESDMANQQGKHDFRPLIQTGLVPRSDIVTNQVQKLEYRPLSQTGLVADNELINQKYRPQIQADTETGSVASQPEYVAQNQTGSERDTVTGQSEIIHDYKPQENISTKADSKVESSEHRPKKGTGLASKSFIVKDKHENKSQTMAGMGSQKNARATGKTKKRNNKKWLTFFSVSVIPPVRVGSASSLPTSKPWLPAAPHTEITWTLVGVSKVPSTHILQLNLPGPNLFGGPGPICLGPMNPGGPFPIIGGGPLIPIGPGGGIPIGGGMPGGNICINISGDGTDGSDFAIAVLGETGLGGAFGALPELLVGGVAPELRRFFFTGLTADLVSRLSMKPVLS
ncbi:hypothetical protein MAR_034564, partial [Mya arenaria]